MKSINNTKTESYRKISFKNALSAILFVCLAVSFCFAGIGFAGTTARADDETVEIMNDHFSVSIDANGYRADFITDQTIYLDYKDDNGNSKNFHGTAAWLNDKSDGIADGLDLGNYLVINGKTFNEIKAAEAGKYTTVDSKTYGLQKGGVWTPISVCAETNRIKLEILRSYTDIGSMTVGLKDGFTCTYNGVTYKVEGDLIFKATLDPSSNFETPIFVKQEAANETKHSIETIARNLESGADNGDYKCFKFFPLLNSDLNASYVSRWLSDHYIYIKDYILINDKSVNYWNIQKYSEEDTYTTNPTGATARQYSTPVVVQFLNNGEFQIYMHSAWAQRNGIDLDNMKISLDAGCPFVKTDGQVYVTANKFSAEKINGNAYYTKAEKEITPSVTDAVIQEVTELKHLVVELNLSEPMDDILWHIIDGYAPNQNALDKILINGKSVKEINGDTDTTGWDWSGGYGFSTTNAALQKPVLILCNGGRLIVYINGQYRALLSNGINTDVKIEIKDGASVMFQPTNTAAGVKYYIEALSETIVYKRTYTLSVYQNGADGEAVQKEVTYGAAIDLSEYGKSGYTVTWKNLEGNAVLAVMPESDYAVYAEYAAITYNAQITYLNGSTENISYTVENRAEKFASLAAKLTAKTAEYEYVFDKAELPLENCTLTETKKPVEYKITLNYAGGGSEEIKFNIENRASVRAEVNAKLTQSTAEYTYSYEGGLPETLPLEDFTLQIVRTAKEYTLTIAYYDKASEDVKFTVENRADVLASLAAKLTPATNGYRYDWKNLPTELTLESQTITETKTAIEYTLTIVYSGDRKQSEDVKFTVENKDTVYASLSDKLLANTEEYAYSWDKTELTLESQTITEIKKAVEYVLTVNYLEKNPEEIKFTVLNKDEVFNSLAEKITPDTAAYVYGWDINGLGLETTTVNETRTAVEYTLTIVYADKDSEDVKFTVENRDTVLASLAAKLTPSTKKYKYEWQNLPTELSLESQTITEIKTEVTDSGCGSAFTGDILVLFVCLLAASVVLKKKKS